MRAASTKGAMMQVQILARPLKLPNALIYTSRVGNGSKKNPQYRNPSITYQPPASFHLFPPPHSRGRRFLGGISFLPMLIQRIRDFCQPCPVSDLFQQFRRGKELHVVWRRIAQRLEQPRRHQHRHIMRLAIQHPRRLFRRQAGRQLVQQPQKLMLSPLSFQFELLEHRMPLAEQIDAPPGVFLRDILGAIIGHIVPAVHRLDPRPAVAVKPFVPNLRSPHVFAVAPQRMDMIPVPPRILLQRVEIRHAPHLRAHEFFVTPLRRPDGRFPRERHVRNDLPRGQRREPNRPFQYSTARLSTANPAQYFVHCSFLTIYFSVSGHTSRTRMGWRGSALRALPRQTLPLGSPCVTTIRTTPRAARNRHE